MDKTTDQLLNLLEAEIDTTDSEPKYCIIDPDRREIYVDPDYQILGVESDENVERVWFQCPKIVGDSVDLSKYQLRVNYQNANRDKGQYIVTDITSEGDNIVFSWLLSRSVTAYVGQISFIICAVNVSSSDIKNEWNTTLAQAQVLTGLEVELQDLPTTGDDLINQLKSLTAQTQTFARTAQAASESAQDNADKVQQQADRVEDILENVPDFNEYDTLAQLEKSFYEGRKYNGMTYAGKTSDKGVQLHSVKGKTVQQTTNGYQLFDASKLATKSQGGATVTNNGDGSFTISGSGNLTDNFANMQYSINSYDFKKLFKVGNVYLKGAINKGIYFEVAYKKSDGNLYQRNNQTINLTNEIYNAITSVAITFYGNSGNAIPNETIKPMLYQDGDGTWEPFTGGKPAPNPDYPMEIENVEISKLVSYGKNIISGFPRGIAYARCEYEYDNVTKELTIKATGNDAYIGEVSSTGNTYKSTNGTLYLVPKNATKVYFRSEKGVFNSVYATFYDENKKSFGYAKVGSYSVPKGAKYVSFRIGVNPSTSETSYTDKVYASFEEIGDYIDGNYEEVETSLTLAEGDAYENGQVTRVRKQITFDGSSDESMTITTIGEINRFLLTIPKGDGNFYSEPNGLCNVLKFEANYTGDYEHFYVQNNQVFVFIDAEKASSVEEFKTWLSVHPITVEYKLETPTAEELKIPTVPSYFPYTEVSTDNELETGITWKVLADCDNSLKQEELEKRIETLEMNALGE